jgi:short-subunit dehydrogenase
MKYALITGATSGIGLALANILAKEGYGLVLVSSNEERLDKTRESIQSKIDIPIHIHPADLSELGTASRLFYEIKAKDINIDILVNNAGFGLAGRTEEIPCDMDERLMILNNMSLVNLCKLFLPQMYLQGTGKILNVASTGAFQPGPFTSTYFASKAFVLSYSKAIRYEAASRGVQVCVLCPGATKTNFFSFEGVPTPKNAMSAESVARYAYNRLLKNHAVSIPGIWNRLAQLAPERIKMKVVAGMKGEH